MNTLARILKTEIVFLAGWTLGGVYVAVLMAFPKLIGAVGRLL